MTETPQSSISKVRRDPIKEKSPKGAKEGVRVHQAEEKKKRSNEDEEMDMIRERPRRHKRTPPCSIKDVKKNVDPSSKIAVVLRKRAERKTPTKTVSAGTASNRNPKRSPKKTATTIGSVLRVSPRSKVLDVLTKRTPTKTASSRYALNG
eukprot:CAMPEP_0198274690 /NCGR_PEP_ID=MMETSP1447-20131203/61400_1 /TAXON_ID=420782 /ORGANISM="Chaetoceros dichaeta, Strain CCMP1751" /LENGTH=149 /DNA_ID=CAMNT_0043969017 /DNA_START=93 /DNA_END=538 /DNA_ORIENTATION=-